MSKENWTWTDELAKEFCEYVGLRVGTNMDIRRQINLLSEDFKKSKEVNPPMQDYEIYSYKKCDRIITCGSYEWEFTKHQFRSGDESIKINSVKRISDNTVWKVGDMHNGISYKNREILSFLIEDGKMMIKQFGGFSELNRISKVRPRTPLFTTEDGVGIYEGEFVFYVDTLSFHLSNVGNISKSIIGLYPTYKYFSTESAAKAWIEENKPCLSLNDLLSVWGSERKDSYLYSIFEKLVKEKLKL